MKKIQRKAKQDEGKSPSDKDKGDKDQSVIKQESPSSDQGHYLGISGMSDSYPTSSQPLNPNMPYSPDGKLITFTKKYGMDCNIYTILLLLLLFVSSNLF